MSLRSMAIDDAAISLITSVSILYKEPTSARLDELRQLTPMANKTLPFLLHSL
jgi:hypothetical protein